FPPSSAPHVEKERQQPPQEVLAACPRCRSKLRLAATLRGKRVRCPRCQVTLHVGDGQLLATLADHHQPSPQTAPPSVSPRAVVNSLGMKLVWVAPGTFQMGSAPGEEGRGPDETPHQVTVTRGFFLGVCPVKQAQWQAVMGYNPSRHQGETRPVENVS